MISLKDSAKYLIDKVDYFYWVKKAHRIESWTRNEVKNYKNIKKQNVQKIFSDKKMKKKCSLSEIISRNLHLYKPLKTVHPSADPPFFFFKKL